MIDGAHTDTAGTHRADGAGPFAVNDASSIIVCDPRWSAMTERMRADVGLIRSRWSEPIVRRIYPMLFIAWMHRIAHTLHIRGHRAPALAVMWLCHALTGTEIRPGAVIGAGLMVVHPSGNVIGGGTVAGIGLQLYGSNCTGSNLRDGIHGSPHLGDDVVMGTHAVALGPSLIGDGALIGAASVVLDDVADGARVKGSPAR